MTKLQRLKEFLLKFKTFAHTDYYILTVCAVVLLVSVLGIDMVGYYIAVATAVAVCLLCDDMQPLIPLFFATFHIVSVKHGSTVGNGQSAYFSTAYIVQFSILAVIAAAALVYGAFRCKNNIKQNYKSNVLVLGSILLAVAFVLNGINIYSISLALTELGFGSKYEFRTTAFGVLTVASWLVPFYYIFITTDKHKADIKYVAKTGTALALLICLQLLIKVIGCAIDGTLFVEGTHQISVSAMHLGWGVANNVGAKLVMLVPFIIYLAITEKYTAVYFWIAVVATVAASLTMSRNAILCAVFIWIAALVLLLIYTKNKKQLYISLGVAAGVLIVLAIIFRQHLIELYGRIFDAGLVTDDGDFADNGRFAIWQRGLELFAKNPIFGTGFFTPAYSADHTFVVVYDNMYHNVIIQMLATCGILGVVAFYQHFVELLKLCFKTDLAGGFMMFAAFTVILLSMLDNYMFYSANLGVYSVCIAYAYLRKNAIKAAKESVQDNDSTVDAQDISVAPIQ